VKVREATALHFSHFQVVKLRYRTQVGLRDTPFFGQQPSDELDRVVPESRRVRVPKNGAAIVKALLTQWTSEVGVIIDVSPCT
jgi:hypothetical protein